MKCFAFLTNLRYNYKQILILQDIKENNNLCSSIVFCEFLKTYTLILAALFNLLIRNYFFEAQELRVDVQSFAINS